VLVVALAVLLNAQFTWWVAHSLRESRRGLDLGRKLLMTETENAALRLELRLEGAACRIVGLPLGVIPAPSEPFSEITVAPIAVDSLGWREWQGRPALVWRLGGGRSAEAFLDMAAVRRWLAEINPSVRLVERPTGSSVPPRAALRPPFDRFVVEADARRWQQMLADYRRSVVIVVGEGVLFFAAMVGGVIILWTVLRRETRRDSQHRNFVSGVTHELKTPIAGIRLALETVLSGRVDQEGSRQFLGNALVDADRLADLVEKVLEVTRYAGGAHTLRIEPGDMSQLVEDEIVAAERHASVRGAVVEGHVDAGVQAPFDPEALTIAVSNLLENALKYAQGNPPMVFVRLRIERGEAVLEVEDTGIGIAPAELESIFEPFYRSSDEITRRTPGTGIGLFVAREIVTAHGGRLTASSRGRGHGATFRMVLPGASVLAEEDV